MNESPDIEQDEAQLRVKLAQLELEHDDLDHAIAALIKVGCDPIRLQRMKKKKLTLKDEIAKLHSNTIPDITA